MVTDARNRPSRIHPPSGLHAGCPESSAARAPCGTLSRDIPDGLIASLRQATWSTTLLPETLPENPPESLPENLAEKLTEKLTECPGESLEASTSTPADDFLIFE